MLDHLSHRETAGLNGNHAELNAKLEAIVRNFDIGWLASEGKNPLQILWKSRDALATNELLNFGDAIENFETLDAGWLRVQAGLIKNGDEGNRAGAIFELLGLNVFVSAGSKVVPSAGSNPGYDGVVELPDKSSLLVSIKNHGMTSYEKSFRKNAEELDGQFRAWLTRHAQSGIELRILCQNNLDDKAWGDLKQDVINILNGRLDGTADSYVVQGEWWIELRHIAPEFHPLSRRNISSVIFICTRAHEREQDKFIEDLRKGCSNLDRHTKGRPDNACPVLFVRLCANASIKNCTDWTRDYFNDFPNERIGLIILYQASVVTSETSSSLSHYILPIQGPKFLSWANPEGQPSRKLPNATFLIGVILDRVAQKVIQHDAGQILLNDTYVYQRADIYRFYKRKDPEFQVHLSNPAPGIKIHAEIEKDGQVTVVQMIAPDKSELLLLP